MVNLFCSHRAPPICSTAATVDTLEGKEQNRTGLKQKDFTGLSCCLFFFFFFFCSLLKLVWPFFHVEVLLHRQKMSRTNFEKPELHTLQIALVISRISFRRCNFVWKTAVKVKIISPTGFCHHSQKDGSVRLTLHLQWGSHCGWEYSSFTCTYQTQTRTEWMKAIHA